MTRWAEFARLVGLMIWKSAVKLIAPLEFFGPSAMSVISELCGSLGSTSSVKVPVMTS